MELTFEQKTANLVANLNKVKLDEPTVKTTVDKELTFLVRKSHQWEPELYMVYRFYVVDDATLKADKHPLKKHLFDIMDTRLPAAHSFEQVMLKAESYDPKHKHNVFWVDRQGSDNHVRVLHRKVSEETYTEMTKVIMDNGGAAPDHDPITDKDAVDYVCSPAEAIKSDRRKTKIGKGKK